MRKETRPLSDGGLERVKMRADETMSPPERSCTVHGKSNDNYKVSYKNRNHALTLLYLVYNYRYL